MPESRTGRESAPGPALGCSAVATQPVPRLRGGDQAAGLARTRNGDLYGQIERPELAGWYAARGFRVLPPGHGLDMAWLIDVPLVVLPGNRQEQIVIRTPQPERRLFVVDPARERAAPAWWRPAP